MDQTGWAWCGNCQGLYFTASTDQGVCPAGGQHDGSGSGHYVLDMSADATAHPHGQSAWAWCHKCQGLGYGPQFASSHCPAGNQHDAAGSGDYTVDFEADDTPADQQRGWRWCNRCQGLFFAGGGAPGVCPAGNGHNSDGSSSYVMRSQAAVLMSSRLSPIVFSHPILLASALYNVPQFAPDQEQAITADSNAVIKAMDGSSWCQLGTWVGWPGNAAAATWQCRSNQLTILVPTTQSGVQVLPFTANFPTASMTLGDGDKLSLTPVLESAQLRLVASLGADPAGRTAYDNAIGALSGVRSGVQSGVGATVTIATSHDISVTVTTVITPGPVLSPPPRFRPVPITRVPILPGRNPVLLQLAPQAAPMSRETVLAAPIQRPELGALTLTTPVHARVDPPPADVLPAAPAGQLVAIEHAPLRIDRTDWSRIFMPGGGGTTTTTVHQTTTAQTETAPLTWHAQSDADCFPDIPRAGVTGDWRQITRQSTPGGSTTNLFYRPGGRPEVFLHLPTAYKLSFHAGDDGSDPPGLPFRVTMARAADGRVTISVSMTAMPYLADDDRAYLRNYIIQNELQTTQPYVELEAASGMAATFQGDFLSAGEPVANSSIRYQLTTATSDLLEIQFTMDELDYGLLVPMLQRGITGEVVLSAGNQAFPVPVALRLDDVITNAIAVDVATNGVAGSAPFVGSLTLTNRLAYPVQMKSLGVDLVYTGAQSDIVFAAEELSASGGTFPLTIAASATSAPLNYVPSLPVWTRTAVVPGVVSVNGPSPVDWIATVNRDPSLQPSKISVTLSPALPAAHAADIRSITVSIFEAGATTARQPPLDIAPGHDAPIELDLSLTELAAGANVRSGYFLEFTSRFADDTRSLPQRVGFDLTRRSIDLLALWEPAGASYFVDSDTTTGPITREAASQVINQLREANRTWAVRAVAPQPAGG